MAGVFGGCASKAKFHLFASTQIVKEIAKPPTSSADDLDAMQENLSFNWSHVHELKGSTGRRLLGAVYAPSTSWLFSLCLLKDFGAGTDCGLRTAVMFGFFFCLI